MEVVRQEREAAILSLHLTHRQVGDKKTTHDKESVHSEKGIDDWLERKSRHGGDKMGNVI